MNSTLQIQRDDAGSSSLDPHAPATDSVIVVEGLVKRFGELTALGGVDLRVEPGTVFGLLGPNGAGKTTMIRVLTTLSTPDEGHASVLGVDVARHPQTVREHIGLAGQYAAVDENLTGRENLRLVGRLTHLHRSVVRPRADELLERFDLVDAADRPVRTYSGGMRRRLDLAAALVHRPPVLFLDEPTTGLDVHSRNDLWSIIAELVGDGTTVLLTTQYLEEADRLADRIAVIDRGQKVAEGTAAELKSSFGNTIIDVGFTDVIDADRARLALQAAATVDANPDHRSMQVSVGNAREVLGIARILDREQLEPETFIVREPTLDDVFLVLTGHAADDTAEYSMDGEMP